MIFLIYIIYAVAYLTIGNSALPNQLNTPNHLCVTCICHARTGCFSLQNCANYSINYKYWEIAGAPTLSNESEVNQESYQACIADDNCIINTIMRYVEVLNKKDCICDEMFDCRDKLSLHLYGENCSVKMARTPQRRYNNCARRNSLPILDPNIECVDVDL
ncbi:Destabilase [Popillia japonica]|uniref:lysozyme n=1 Tax=Popillia japonica TaxID=7064 RepID=A0AAW1JDR4_POPJA